MEGLPGTRMRVAIVTGGARGIGAAITDRLVADGMHVVVADLLPPAAREQVEHAAVDVTDPVKVARMVEHVMSAHGAIDVLVNNAMRAPADGLRSMSVEDWDHDVAIGLRAPYLCTRAVLDPMIAAGAGAIVNVASVNAFGFLGREAYSAAKAGLLSLTSSTAVRYGPFGIRANAVAPGTVRTEIWERRVRAEPGLIDQLVRWYPLGRVGEPADVANAVAFLAGEQAAWISGVVLPVDGGLSAGNHVMAVDMRMTSED